MTSNSISMIETKNHAFALKIFRKYNSPQYPLNYATISKKKGGDKTFTYIVSIYKLCKKENG